MAVRGQRRTGEVRTSLELAAGAIVSGLAAYAYLSLGTRAFGQPAFAPASVVWSTWAIGAAALTLPLEQWIARSMAARGGASVAIFRRRTGQAAGLVLAVLTVGAWVLRQPLFSEDGWAYPLCLGGTWVGAMGMGVARGQLSGAGRFRATAVLYAGENLARLAAGAAMVAAGLGPVAFTAAIPLGSITAMAGLFTRGHEGEVGASCRDDEGRPARQAVALSALIAASVIAQVVLTGGPVLAAILGAAAADVTGLFTALALFRAPYQLLGGFSGRLAAGFTRAWLDASQAAVRTAVGRRLAWGALALTSLAVGLAQWIGRDVIRLVFGQIDVPQVVVTTTAGVTAMAMVTFVASILLVAMDMTLRLVRVWLVGLMAAVVPLALPVADVATRVAAAAATAELVALAGMLAVVLMNLRKGPDRPHGQDGVSGGVLEAGGRRTWTFWLPVTRRR